jgi:hypothetical protein
LPFVFWGLSVSPKGKAIVPGAETFFNFTGADLPRSDAFGAIRAKKNPFYSICLSIPFKFLISGFNIPAS